VSASDPAKLLTASTRPAEVADDRTVRPAPLAAIAPIPFTETIASSRGRRDYIVRRALAAADLCGIAIAATLAFAISPARDGLQDLPLLLSTLPAWLLLFALYGLYQRDVKRINHPGLDELPALFHALVIGSLAAFAYFKLFPVHNLALGEVLPFGLAGLVLIPTARSFARYVTDRHFGPERTLFIGAGELLEPMVRKIRDHPEYALEPVGLVTTGAHSDTPAPLPVVGHLPELDVEAVVRSHRIERLIVTHPEVPDDTLLALVRQCGQLQVKVGILPRYVEAIGPSVQIDDIEGMTVLGLNPLGLPRSSRALKRTMDLVGAGIGLIVFAPALALTAIAVRIDSRGPVLFRQQRVGKSGRPFTLLKFRTMVTDAEERLDGLVADSQDPHWLKLDHDPRVTRVGRALRMLSFDELPQLWNVFRGDMSLVGPRPLIGREDERVLGWARARLHLAPGITGLWQVLGRTNIPFAEMIKLDYLYVTNWSLWTDAKLVIRTIPVVMRRKGAN
jgi:exopolysaccharide biosynthesis polyprenyl glycosylphosphotransferase